MSNVIEETDEQRLKRIKETGLFKDSKDILVQIQNSKPLTDEEVQCLLKAVTEEND